jgi:outer membrane murein-binding lipoprotein Lpp
MIDKRFLIAGASSRDVIDRLATQGQTPRARVE